MGYNDPIVPVQGGNHWIWYTHLLLLTSLCYIGLKKIQTRPRCCSSCSIINICQLRDLCVWDKMKDHFIDETKWLLVSKEETSCINFNFFVLQRHFWTKNWGFGSIYLCFGTLLLNILRISFPHFCWKIFKIVFKTLVVPREVLLGCIV